MNCKNFSRTRRGPLALAYSATKPKRNRNQTLIKIERLEGSKNFVKLFTISRTAPEKRLLIRKENHLSAGEISVLGKDRAAPIIAP